MHHELLGYFRVVVRSAVPAIQVSDSCFSHLSVLRSYPMTTSNAGWDCALSWGLGSKVVHRPHCEKQDANLCSMSERKGESEKLKETERREEMFTKLPSKCRAEGDGLWFTNSNIILSDWCHVQVQPPQVKRQRKIHGDSQPFTKSLKLKSRILKGR